MKAKLSIKETSIFLCCHVRIIFQFKCDALHPSLQLFLAPKQRHLSSGEHLFHWCLQVSQVPDDPEDQAEEDQERPRENQEIPEAQGCEDSDEEQDQANSIQKDSDEVEPQTPAQVSSVIHDK